PKTFLKKLARCPRGIQGVLGQQFTIEPCPVEKFFFLVVVGDQGNFLPSQHRNDLFHHSISRQILRCFVRKPRHSARVVQVENIDRQEIRIARNGRGGVFDL